MSATRSTGFLSPNLRLLIVQEIGVSFVVAPIFCFDLCSVDRVYQFDNIGYMKCEHCEHCRIEALLKQARGGKVSDKTVGAKIQYHRKRKSLSQKSLAKILGYKSATAISLIESGQRSVDAVMLNKISNVLDTNIVLFF